MSMHTPVPGAGAPGHDAGIPVPATPFAPEAEFMRGFASLETDLLRFACSLLRGDAHAARDAVQETFVAAWGQRGRFHDLDHLRSWCFHVARCRAVSWQRKHAWRGRMMTPLSALTLPEALQPWSTGTPPPTAEALREREASHRLLRDAVRGLPHGYAAAVELHYLHGHDLAHTARMLGTTRGGVKMRLVRAREHLRLVLEGVLGRTPARAASPARAGPPLPRTARGRRLLASPRLERPPGRLHVPRADPSRAGHPACRPAALRLRARPRARAR